MNVLGICNTFDSGAALIIDGVVIAAANEERFLREKQTKEFPEMKNPKNENFKLV